MSSGRIHTSPHYKDLHPEFSRYVGRWFRIFYSILSVTVVLVPTFVVLAAASRIGFYSMALGSALAFVVPAAAMSLAYLMKQQQFAKEWKNNLHRKI